MKAPPHSLKTQMLTVGSLKIMKTRIILAGAVLALLSIPNPQLSAATMGTAFTYQGRLTAGGSVAQGIYDFRFAVHDAESGGAQVGVTLTNAAVSVSNGLFTVTLDFGVGIFAGDSRWLAIGVRTNGGGPSACCPDASRSHPRPTPFTPRMP